MLPNGWQATAKLQPTLKIKLQAGCHSNYSAVDGQYHLLPQVFESFFKAFDILLVRPCFTQ
jgi:hypothetical protein